MTLLTRFLLLALSLAALLLPACSSKPDMVLDEDEMIDLLTDIHKSEAIIDMNTQKFAGDSMKAVVRQSVFAKHGVTQEQYDSSMVWYGHNVGKYIKVYDGVIARLEDEELELAQAESPKGVRVKRVKKRYPSAGDSADIWDKERAWILLPQYRRNIIRFDIAQKPDDQSGDCYTLIYRMRNSAGAVKSFIGADYYDGTTSYAYRTSGMEGDAQLKLQCDSTKRVKRVYGYIAAEPATRECVFVDSIMLLRTRLNADNYRVFDVQKWSGPKAISPAALKKKAAEAEKRAAEAKDTEEPESDKSDATPPSHRPRRIAPKPTER